MDAVSDRQLYDVILPLLYQRPSMRKKLGLILMDLVKDEKELSYNSQRKRPVVALKKPKVFSPSFELFTRVRRLVILAGKPGAKDFDIFKQLEEEWERMTPSERTKWEDLSNAGNKVANESNQ